MSVPTFPLSGFADEIAADLETQIATLVRLGIKGLDLRSVDGVNVLQIGGERLVEIGEKCKAAGLHIQCVGSPVNKVYYGANARRDERAKFLTAVNAAKSLGTKRIRIFSPEVPTGQNELMWPDLRSWMADMVDLAKSEGMIILHENDGKYFGAYPENAKKLFEAFGGPHFKAAFDFANTVLIGYRPMRDWFPWLLPHLDTLHVKDAIESEGKVVPAGEGDGQLRETLEWLIGQGWRGTLTLEPHLQATGPFGGFSGPELFEAAVTALRALLSSAAQGFPKAV